MGLPLTQNTSLHLSFAPQTCCCSRNRRRTLAVSMRSGRSWARECVSVNVMCVSECVSVWGDGWHGMERASSSASARGTLPSPYLCSLSPPSPLFLLFNFPPPFLPPLSMAGVPSLRWCWPRSGAPHTLLLSSASPRRPFKARRPWWRMRLRCSAGACLAPGQAAIA